MMPNVSNEDETSSINEDTDAMEDAGETIYETVEQNKIYEELPLNCTGEVRL